MQVTFDRLDELLVDVDGPSGRYRRAAAQFDARVRAMPDNGWDEQTPCAGWIGRDVVAHLVEWVPSVIGKAGIEFPPMDARTDPVAAWTTLDTTLQAALDDPDVATRRFDAGPPGELTVETAIGMLVRGRPADPHLGSRPNRRPRRDAAGRHGQRHARRHGTTR